MDQAWQHRTARIWLRAVQLQLQRLHEAEQAGARLALGGDRPSHYTSEHALPLHDAEVDRHFLLNAAHLLSVALQPLPSPPAPRHDADLLAALRNSSEHASEGALRKGTQTTLSAAGVSEPRAYAWNLSRGSGVIGGVLSVGDAQGWAADVESYLRDLEGRRHPQRRSAGLE